MRNPAHLSIIGKLRLRLKRCPNCGGRFIRIVYGLPSVKAQKEAQVGKVVLWGCVVSPDDPIAKCSKCNTFLNRDFSTETCPEKDPGRYHRVTKEQE